MNRQESLWYQNSSRYHVGISHQPKNYLHKSRVLFKDLSPQKALFSGATAAPA
jgi:hypothetical protein